MSRPLCRPIRRFSLLSPGLALLALTNGCASGRAPTAGPDPADAEGISSAPVRLRVLATGDIHGNLHPTTPASGGGRAMGGAAVLAAYFARERAAAAAPTVLLDAGDVMQGTPVSNLTAGRASVAFFNAVGYAAAAIGNHEFDWGIDTLRARMTEARFAWLGANISVRGTDTLPSWLEAATLVTLVHCGPQLPCDSVRVGVIGIATEATPNVVRRSLVASLDFGDAGEAIDLWVPRLRARGADFVIVTAHSGAVCDVGDPAEGCEGEIIDAALRLRNRPDLIVAGHTHAQVNVLVNGIRIVQSGENGARFSIVDLERIDADSVAVRVRGQPAAYVDEIAPDSAVAALVAAFDAEVGQRVAEVIATVPNALRRQGLETSLGNLIADAQRAAGGTQVAIVNNGGIRTELQAGPVTYGDLLRLQPFANGLLTMQLTGAQLRAALEHSLGARGRPTVHVSGLQVEYDPAAEEGGRIRSLRLDTGDAVLPGELYSVTVNDFLGQGGDGFAMLRSGVRVERTGIVDVDALIAFLRDRDPVPLPPTGRFRQVE